MVSVGEILWEPSQEWVDKTNLSAFRQWLKENQGVEFDNLHQLRRWSLDHLDDFWQAVWDFFKVEAATPPTAVLGKRTMPGAEWFPGSTLNYAQHILRNEKPGEAALMYANEDHVLHELEWSELADSVRILATELRKMGIQRGDRVACYMTNIPQAAIALLACSSIGAIWSSCSPDFGTHSVLDRLSQIEPKVLFCVDGYHYKGKAFDRRNSAQHRESDLFPVPE